MTFLFGSEVLFTNIVLLIVKDIFILPIVNTLLVTNYYKSSY